MSREAEYQEFGAFVYDDNRDTFVLLNTLPAQRPDYRQVVAQNAVERARELNRKGGYRYDTSKVRVKSRTVKTTYTSWEDIED